MVEISPSLIASDYNRLGAVLKSLEDIGLRSVHIDVMDGHFVPNITIGPDVVKDLRPHSKLLFDVHLMITYPLDFIEKFAAAGADAITFHIEAEADPDKAIDKIHACGKKAGIALRPATDPKAVFQYLERLYSVMVMTVEPGFSGQKFMQDKAAKIRQLKDEIIRRGLDVKIEVDGGINTDTIGVVAKNGVDVVVVGSAFFKDWNLASTAKSLTDAAIAATGF